jgi:hypothetical protein
VILICFNLYAAFTDLELEALRLFFSCWNVYIYAEVDDSSGKDVNDAMEDYCASSRSRGCNLNTAAR